MSMRFPFQICVCVCVGELTVAFNTYLQCNSRLSADRKWVPGYVLRSRRAARRSVAVMQRPIQTLVLEERCCGQQNMYAWILDGRYPCLKTLLIQDRCRFYCLGFRSSHLASHVLQALEGLGGRRSDIGAASAS